MTTDVDVGCSLTACVLCIIDAGSTLQCISAVDAAGRRSVHVLTVISVRGSCRSQYTSCLRRLPLGSARRRPAARCQLEWLVADGFDEFCARPLDLIIISLPTFVSYLSAHFLE